MFNVTGLIYTQTILCQLIHNFHTIAGLLVIANQCNEQDTGKKRPSTGVKRLGEHSEQSVAKQTTKGNRVKPSNLSMSLRGTKQSIKLHSYIYQIYHRSLHFICDDTLQFCSLLVNYISFNGDPDLILFIFSRLKLLIFTNFFSKLPNTS